MWCKHNTFHMCDYLGADGVHTICNMRRNSQFLCSQQKSLLYRLTLERYTSLMIEASTIREVHNVTSTLTCASMASNSTLILIQLGQQQYSYMYSYGQIALAIARAVIGHTRTRVLITALIVL